jgi:hypothetical protein
MDKYLETIIGGAIGLAGVVLGFLLRLLSISISERKRVKQEFAEIKNVIYSTRITNNLFPALLNLKQFFVRNSQYLRREENNSFFQKWLMGPLVEEAFTGIGYWSKEKIEEMFHDLDKTGL